MVSATIGVTSLCLGGVQPWSAFNFLWFMWWMGDAAGVLIVAPVLLVWGTPPYNKPALKKMMELLLLTDGVAIYIERAFLSFQVAGQRLTYLIFIFIIWAALRFGQRGTTLVTLAVSAASIWATLHRIGPFIGADTERDLIFLGLFALIVEVTGLFLGATIAELKESGKQLQTSKLHARLIFDSALDAVVSINSRGIVTEWTKVAETIFGWPASEAVGSEMAEMIIPPAYRERHKQGLSRFFRDGTSNLLNKRVEMEALTRSGVIIPVELAITVQKNEVYFFTAFIRDLRVEKQIESVRGLLSAIVESSSDAIISKTLTGVITSWNTGAERLLGYSADEIINKNVVLIIPPDRLEEELRVTKELSEGKKSEPFETVRITKTASRWPFPLPYQLSGTLRAR